MSLLADTAEAALTERRFAECRALLDRAGTGGPLPEMRNLAGLAAMGLGEWDDAATQFETLLAENPEAPSLRFNLAWCLAMLRRFEEALALLDAGTSGTLGQAAQLEVQLLHELGQFEVAEARARALLDTHQGHSGFNAAVATLATDIEDSELARLTAERSGSHPDALAALGTLALADDDPDTAAGLFEAALERDEGSARAWIGRGLVNLLGDDQKRAASDLDRGAALFETHLGSWIAAGWAHFVAGDRDAARQRFETALGIDDSFGEAQGSLAVIELFEGHIEEARKRCDVARRLDRDAFSVALATMLLAAGAGDHHKAARILEAALETPLPGGRTLAQALVRLGSRTG